MTDRDTISIRAANAGDLPGELALYAPPDIDNGKILPVQDAGAIFARFSRYPDCTLYVAEPDNQVVGSFALLVMDDLGHLGASSAMVEDVAVDPALHSQGIGRAMMRFGAERAREKRCYKIVLSSDAKRERAHAFYERLGFERQGYSFHLMLEPVLA